MDIFIIIKEEIEHREIHSAYADGEDAKNNLLILNQRIKTEEYENYIIEKHYLNRAEELRDH